MNSNSGATKKNARLRERDCACISADFKDRPSEVVRAGNAVTSDMGGTFCQQHENGGRRAPPAKFKPA